MCACACMRFYVRVHVCHSISVAVRWEPWVSVFASYQLSWLTSFWKFSGFYLIPGTVGLKIPGILWLDLCVFGWLEFTSAFLDGKFFVNWAVSQAHECFLYSSRMWPIWEGWVQTQKKQTSVVHRAFAICSLRLPTHIYHCSCRTHNILGSLPFK